MVSEELLREAARAAMDNADELLADATLLHENGRPARALSLAIIGSEETGKALMFTLASLDAIPDLRASLGQQRYWGLTDHPLKQVLSQIVGHAEYVADEYADVVSSAAPEAGSPGLLWWLEQFLRQCAEWAEKQVGDRKEPRRTQQFFKKIVEDFHKRFRQGQPPGPAQTPDEEKWNALYVDLAEGKVRTPASITADQAWSKIVDLQIGLEATQRLRSALADDAVWDALRVRFP